jgi:hypothetical protein
VIRESALTLRIVQGPLEPHENGVILSDYNRLTSSQIPMPEFLHWIQNSPEGPACHAILETDSHEIVGHQCLIPLRATCEGRRFIAAKSEYAFLREEFQANRIRGFEEWKGPKHIVAAHQLFQHCRAAGWGPFLIVNPDAARQRRGFYGFRATDFILSECLLVLRPWLAVRETPNLVRWQRVLLGLAGSVQQIGWSPINFLPAGNGRIRSVRVSGGALPNDDSGLSFFEDEESLRWRYLEGQYQRLAMDAKGEDYMIVKKGARDSYLRVCQWKLSADRQVTFSLIASLVQMAQKQKALGIRWAIYGEDAAKATLVRRLRRFGFLCASRIRTLMINANEKEFLVAGRWNLNDAMFSFHHYKSTGGTPARPLTQPHFLVSQATARASENL